MLATSCQLTAPVITIALHTSVWTGMQNQYQAVLQIQMVLYSTTLRFNAPVAFHVHHMIMLTKKSPVLCAPNRFLLVSSWAAIVQFVYYCVHCVHSMYMTSSHQTHYLIYSSAPVADCGILLHSSLSPHADIELVFSLL